MTIIHPEISKKMSQDLKEQILNDLLWKELEKLASFLMPFVRLICLFESDEPLLSHTHAEWQTLQETVNLCDLNLECKLKVLELIDKQFNFAFHPAMAIANLLDPW